MVILRTSFYLLILANLVLFAWGQGYFGERDASREPQRLAQQFNQEQVRVVRISGGEATPGVACRIVAGLSAADAATLAGAAQAAGAGWQAKLLRDEPAPDYRVVIGELAGRAVAEKKSGELRALGVKEFFQEEAGGQYTLVLASFGDEAAAKEALAAYAKKGLRTAKVEARSRQADKPRVELRAPATALVRSLPGLLASYAGAAVTECAAP